VVKSNLEALLFIVGILCISAIVVWMAWAAFGFLEADVPVVKIVRP
jgi:hypothetical protein